MTAAREAAEARRIALEKEQRQTQALRTELEKKEAEIAESEDRLLASANESAQ